MVVTGGAWVVVGAGGMVVVTTGSVVVGQGPPGDPCTVEINAEVYPKLKEMGIERWAEACREARATTIE